MMGMSPGGLLRGATALFLLALVFSAYGRSYCCNTPPPAKTPGGVNPLAPPNPRDFLRAPT